MAVDHVFTFTVVWWTCAPGVLTGAPWEMIRLIPSKVNSIPSVATNELIPTTAMKKPLTAPTAIQHEQRDHHAWHQREPGGGRACRTGSARTGTSRRSRGRSRRGSSRTPRPPRGSRSGAKYGSSVLKLAPVKKVLVFSEKYTAVTIVTTMMLPSRSDSTRASGLCVSRERARGSRPPRPPGSQTQAVPLSRWTPELLHWRA